MKNGIYILICVQPLLYGMNEELNEAQKVKKLFEQPVEQTTSLKELFLRTVPIASTKLEQPLYHRCHQDHESVTNLCLNSDDTLIAVASKNISYTTRDLSLIRVWHTIGTVHRSYELYVDIKDMLFSPHNSYVAAVTTDDNINIQNLDNMMSNGMWLNGHAGHLNMMSFSNDEKSFLSAFSTGYLYVWDLITENKPWVAARLQLDGTMRNPLTTIGFSPDAQYIGCASDDQQRVWSRDGTLKYDIDDDCDSEDVDWLVNHKKNNSEIGFNIELSTPNTISLVSNDKNHTILRVLTQHKSAITKTLLNRNGNLLLSGSDDGVVYLLYLTFFNKVLQEKFSSEEVDGFRQVVEQKKKEFEKSITNAITDYNMRKKYPPIPEVLY